MMRWKIRAALALACMLDASASANPLKSLYTTIELEGCRKVRSLADRREWLCAGLDGYPVFIAEASSRTFVSVGADAHKRRAASQTLGAANALFRGASRRATLEWRFVRREGKIVPYATIQRYFTRATGREGEVLVVTKVTASEDCHVAYVDAIANTDAIALARSFADSEARNFDCASDPRRLGRAGRSPM